MMGGDGMMAAEWLWPVLMVGGVVLLVYLVVRLVRDGVEDRPGGRGRTAREVLDERYARGELDDEEYDRRRDKLS